MSDFVLTRDNTHLSRLTKAAEWGPLGIYEINFNNPSKQVAEYVEQGLSNSSKRAYSSDLTHFEAWGGTIPASDSVIASYLAEHANNLSLATLVRRLAALSKAHSAKGLISPTQSELVKATMRGIKRSKGTAQTEARPLLRDDLFAILERTADDVKSVRDRALLLIGFAGAFRRSELARLNFEDIVQVRQGIIIHLRRSKTDQYGAGRKIGIPIGRGRWCPVTSLREWMQRGEITEGAIFRRINRHGQIHRNRISGEAVSIVLKSRAAKAGMDDTGYSGHSLRAGLATSAAMAGASQWKIRQQTGHASDAMLNRNIRDGDIFNDNAAAYLF